jgi:hypothetical protein
MQSQASRLSSGPATNGDRVRLEAFDNDGELRFKLLNEWVVKYLDAIIRRASRPWTSPQQLVEGIPYWLRPDTEVIAKNILLIGTKNWTEAIAVLLGSKPPEPFADWFQPSSPFPSDSLQTPAIVVRSNGVFRLLRPGMLPQNTFAPTDPTAADTPIPAEGRLTRVIVGQFEELPPSAQASG